jgi:flavodoxin
MTPSSSERPTHAAEYIKGDWDKSVFLGNPHVDNLMTAFIGLGGEHWALQRRLMVIEKLLETRCGIGAAEIEGYLPTEEDQRLWERRRDDFIERVFAVLVRETGDVSGPIDTANPTLQPPRAAGEPR